MNEKPMKCKEKRTKMNTLVEKFRREALGADDENFDKLFQLLEKEIDALPCECGTHKLAQNKADKAVNVSPIENSDKSRIPTNKSKVLCEDKYCQSDEDVIEDEPIKVDDITNNHYDQANSIVDSKGERRGDPSFDNDNRTKNSKLNLNEEASELNDLVNSTCSTDDIREELDADAKKFGERQQQLPKTAEITLCKCTISDKLTQITSNEAVDEDHNNQVGERYSENDIRSNTGSKTSDEIDKVGREESIKKEEENSSMDSLKLIEDIIANQLKTIKNELESAIAASACKCSKVFQSSFTNFDSAPYSNKNNERDIHQPSSLQTEDKQTQSEPIYESKKESEEDESCQDETCYNVPEIENEEEKESEFMDKTETVGADHPLIHSSPSTQDTIEINAQKEEKQTSCECHTDEITKTRGDMKISYGVFCNGQLPKIQNDNTNLAEVGISSKRSVDHENIQRIKVRIKMNETKEPLSLESKKKTEEDVKEAEFEKHMGIRQIKNNSDNDFQLNSETRPETMVQEAKVIRDGEKIRILIPLTSDERDGNEMNSENV